MCRGGWVNSICYTTGADREQATAPGHLLDKSPVSALDRRVYGNESTGTGWPVLRWAEVTELCWLNTAESMDQKQV